VFVLAVTAADTVVVVVVGDMAVNSLVVVVLGAIISSLLGPSSSNMNRFLVFG
jgi:hypothetical protein